MVMAARKPITGKPRPKARKYTDAQIAQAIELFGEAGSMVEACAQLGLGYSAAMKRIHSDDDLSEKYARARREFLQQAVEQMNYIVDTEPDTQKARLKCDNIKWEAQRVLPRKYGERTSLDHGVQKDNPLEDLAKAFTGAIRPKEQE